ncbi:MAG: PEP-CTERM sorting domain-containing protein [Planctomycetota bacterium]
MYRRLTALALVTPLALATNATAELIAYEGFNYTAPNTVDGLNGGSGWATPWDDLNDGNGHTFDIVAPGETYPGLLSSGNAMIEDEQNTASINSSLYERQIDLTGSPDFLSGGTEGWISYIVNVSGSGSHGMTFGLSTGNANQQQQLRVYRGNGTNIVGSGQDVTNGWVLQIGGNADVWETADGGDGQATGQSLVLIKIESVSGADPVSVWINPDLSSEAALGAPQMFLDTNGVSQNDLLRFSAGNFPTSVTYDEIRVGTSFASVIPEPGSLGLAGFGVAVLCFGRRRED